jgi:signal transduction histidine kinase/CheY-like chemotaxis protein/HPt (histidine-containing phosphotransfer) domain-containing protein
LTAARPASRREFSLSVLLGASLLLLVMLPAAWLAASILRPSLQDTQDLASRSLNRIAAQVQSGIDNHLLQAHRVLDGLMPPNASPGNATQAAAWVSDPALFAPMAIALTRSSKDLRFVYFRSENGSVHGVENAADGLRFSDRSAVDNGARSALVIASNAPLKSLSGVGESPDPRGQPWWDAAINSDQRSFSPPLVYPVSKQLVVTLSQRVVGPTGLVTGLLGADLSLQAVPALLKAQSASPGSVAFLIDDRGLLLASTADPVAADGQSAQWLLRSPRDSSSQVVRAAFAGLEARWSAAPGSKIAAAPRALHLPTREGMLFASYLPVGQNPGLQWTLVVAAPEADFYPPVSWSSNLVLAALAILVLGSTALVLWGGHLARGYLAWLHRTIDRLQEGVIPPSARLTSVRELNAVDSSLHRLAVKMNKDRSDVFAEALVVADGSEDGAKDLHALQARLAERSSELAAARDKVQVAVRSKTAFLAVVSHELRTPLNGVVGMSALLADTPLNAEQRDYLKSLGIACSQLQKLIDNILEYARIESGEILLQNTAFDVRALVQQACSVPAKAAQAKGLQLVIDVPGAVPRGDEPEAPWVIQGDPERLAQVIGELAVNAVKFTDSGSVIVQVRPVHQTDPNDVPMLETRVIDTGPGFSPEDISSLFAAFTTGDSSISRRHGGPGLGLATCKRLVELMGGELSVDTATGSGSTFRFTVLAPWAEAHALQSAWVAQEMQHAVNPADIEPDKTSILVVDDNPINLKVACAMLLRLNYRVLTAEGGAEAVTIVADSLASGRPLAAVVMDVHMPGVDGIQATRTIRASHGAMAPPIIALTAASSADDCQGCHEAGMVEYLTKPLQISALTKALEKWAPPPAGPSTALTPVPLLAAQAPHTGPAQVAAPPRASPSTPPPAPAPRAAISSTGTDELVRVLQDAFDERDRVSAPVPLFERFSEADISMPMELVDFGRLNDFKEFDDSQLSMTREVIGLLFNEVPLQLAAIERAISKDDAAGLSSAAHSLRGAASNVGAVTVQHLCSVLERSTLELQAVPGDAGGCLVALRIAWNRTRPLLENWC